MALTSVQSSVALAIFIATYAALALRNVKGFHVPIWLVLLIGAALMVLSGSITVGSAYSAVNLQVIVFLFSMFVIVVALDMSGGLEAFAIRLLGRARRPEHVLYLTFVGFALLSSVLMNDTIALMGTPIMIAIARRLGMSPGPLLLTLAFAVTTGSVMTPMGNPQNLLVAIASGMHDPVIEFARYLLVPTAVNMLLMLLLLKLLFRKDIGAAKMPDSQVASPLGEDKPLLRKSVLVLLLTLAGIILVNILEAFGLAVPFGISEVSFFGAVLLLGISGRSRDILNRVDWGILVLFAGLFVLMQAVSDNGIISSLSAYLPALNAGNARGSMLAIIVSSVLLSQVLSNVPMVALYIPLMKTLGFGASAAYAWAALAGGSTLAGNLTLLGAASNLIIVETAEKSGFKIGFLQFLKVGVIVTAVEVAVLYLFMYVLV